MAGDTSGIFAAPGADVGITSASADPAGSFSDPTAVTVSQTKSKDAPGAARGEIANNPKQDQERNKGFFGRHRRLVWIAVGVLAAVFLLPMFLKRK